MKRRGDDHLDLWTYLKKENLLPFYVEFMKSFEPELRVLIQHIELRVKAREGSLKQQVKKVYKHYEKKTKECEQHKLTCEENFQKAISLQAQLEDLTEVNNDIRDRHLIQVNKFKENICQLQLMYDKLNDKFTSEMNDLKERNRLLEADVDDPRNKIIQLTEKLKTCINNLKTVKRQKADFKRNFEIVTSQCKILLDKNENINDINEGLVVNFDEVEREGKENEQEVYRLQALVKQQEDDLIDFGKSDNLLKNAVIAMRNDMKIQQDNINKLESELNQCKEDEENRMKVDHAIMHTLRSEHYESKYKLNQLRQDTEGYSSAEEQIKALQAKCNEYEKLVEALNMKEEVLSTEVNKTKNKFEKEYQMKLTNLQRQYQLQISSSIMTQSSEVDETIENLEDQLRKEQERNIQLQERFQNKIGALSNQNDALNEQLLAFHQQREEVEEEEENKRVDELYQLNKQVGDIVHQSTLKQSRAVNPANQKNLQHVLGTIDIQPKQSDNVCQSDFKTTSQDLEQILWKNTQVYLSVFALLHEDKVQTRQ